MKPQARIVLGMLVATFIVLTAACARPSDETQIRDALAAMQEAVESAKPADFMRHIAADFTGEDGTLDRTSLHNLLRAQVLGNSRIGVSVSLVDIKLQGERATVKLSVALTGGNGRWIPERGSIQRIESGWRKQDGEWQCVNAQWERAL